MFQLFWNKHAEKLGYALLWLLFALFQSISTHAASSLSWEISAVYSAIQAILFIGLSQLLWNVIRYAKLSMLHVFHRATIHIALAMLTVSVWVAASYALVSIGISESNNRILEKLLPMHVFTGLLVYTIVVQHIQRRNTDAGELQEPFQASDISGNEEIELQNTPSERELLDRIAVKSGSKIHVIMVGDIVCLQADGDYVQIVTTQGKYLKEQTMKYFEEHLAPSQFVRVHRSVIVNVEMISRIELYEKKNQLLSMKNGLQIKTSPTGYKSLRAVLKL